MSKETPVTKHVNACVKLLNEALQVTRHPDPNPMARGYEAIFELIDMPWDGTEDPDWREGYETCLLDVIEHIAQEWNVDLPKLKVPK